MVAGPGTPIVKPEVVIALGATAARSLIGRIITITQGPRRPIDLADGSRLIVTIHPSALLRTEDEADKRVKYPAFVKDLKTAAQAGVPAGGVTPGAVLLSPRTGR